MTTRFTITDHGAANRAAAALPNALNTLASTINVAGQQLRPHPGDPVAPHKALAALVKWQRGERRRDARIATVLLLLAECGASERGLADALGLSRGTVATRIAQARVDRAAETEETSQ